MLQMLMQLLMLTKAFEQVAAVTKPAVTAARTGNLGFVLIVKRGRLMSVLDG